VILTHFPVSAFAGAFLFMTMHLVTRDECWSRASFVTLLAATAILIPTTLTGWLEWRRTYERFMNKVFRYKIRIALAMLPLALALTAFQLFAPLTKADTGTALEHAVYFAGLGLLSLGAAAEGYYGGRLHHR
jgi:uncharacterized membrane protein